MPYIDPEIILQAKQMDLLTYLQNYEPQELVRFSGNVYCTRTHDSLKISNGKMILSKIFSAVRVRRDYEVEIDMTVDCEQLGIVVQ
jgi:hypothetical protein